MRHALPLTALTLLVLGSSGCIGGSGSRGGNALLLVDLEGSIEPVRGWFDEHGDRPRALLILSPV